MKIDLSELRKPDFDASELLVLGARLGGPATSIPREFISAADGFPTGGVVGDDGKVAHICDRKSAVGMSLDSQIDAVVERGGWLRSLGLVWKIREGNIQALIVREPHLSRLRVTSEKKLRRMFGIADTQRLTGSGTIYYYPERNLTIEWDTSRSNLSSIVVGSLDVDKSQQSDPASGKIKLRNHRDITLSKLNQWSVYAGLLEGLPTQEMNDRIIEGIISKERTRYEENWAPYLVPPNREPIDIEERYPFGKPERIPSVACVGYFSSLDSARDRSKDFSFLTIIWFQATFAMPIDGDVLKHIESFDWEEHAHDGWY